MHLCEELEKYKKREIYPFHMPGHKRNPRFFDGEMFAVDITEIDGFDDLHDPTGILKEEQERAARLFGSDESFLLVNGSTCGILAGVSAAVPIGGKVIVARGCHRSVYNGIELRQAETLYIEPEPFCLPNDSDSRVDSDAGCIDRNFPDNLILGQIPGKIRPEDIEATLKANPDAALVIITSPTYEGVVSDIERIAKICHDHKTPLMVDAAHGAHLKFAAGINGKGAVDDDNLPASDEIKFPVDAVSQGADIVVNSLHKTLPAMTGTSLLHVNTRHKLVDITQVKHYLDIYQTSSPSYVLMSSISSCLRFLEGSGAESQFKDYAKRLSSFYRASASFNRVKILTPEGRDPGKIVIIPPDGMSGQELMRILREDHKIEAEFARDGYVLAMTSVCDTDEGFDRLTAALQSI